MTAARRAFGAARRRVPWAALALILIAVAALAVRVYGLNWDANNHLHPDEREIVFVSMCLTFPAQVAARPPSCAPAITGPGWLFSTASPLNPHFFAYGAFPLYLLAAVCHALAWLTHLTGGRFAPTDGGAWDDFNHFTLVGRVLSALFDTGSVILVALLGRRLAGVRVGLLAAALAAVIPFDVQVSHFYAVDTVLLFFILLTLLACVRLAPAPAGRAEPAVATDAATDGAIDLDAPQSAVPALSDAWRGWGVGLFAGAALGLAVATKVSALPLLLPVALALVIRWRRRSAEQAGIALFGVLAAAIVAFIITSPYALIDSRTFWSQVNEQSALSRGQLDYPYVRQFAGTTPFVYQIQQLLLYDMGLPLGLLGLAGFAWALGRLWRRWDDEWGIIVAWLVVYFAVIGEAYTKFTRYMLPVFPLLALCGAAAIVALAARAWRTSPPAQGTSPPCPQWGTPSPPHRGEGSQRAAGDAGRRGKGSWRTISQWGMRLRGSGLSRLVVLALAASVLATSAFFTLALDNIYSAPNTRVSASEWIYDHVPAGATITSEVWDDSLPILVPAAQPGPLNGRTAAGQVIDPGQYIDVGLNLYDDDTPLKAQQLAQDLATANVVVISSQRLVRSIPKFPDRYPMTTRYYQLLFAGQLGFKLAVHFATSPHLLGFVLDDTGADESFSVYDHPPIWIFTRSGPALTAVQLQARLTDGLALPPPYDRPGNQKSLLLTPAQTAADAQSLPLAAQFPADSFANRVPLVWWLAIVELLGLVSFPLTYFAFPGLRDRGWGLSKLLGLLLLTYMLWMGASLAVLPFDQSVVIGVFVALALTGAAVAWWRRRELLAFARARWRLLAVSEAGFLAVFLLFTWIRALDPDLWHIWRGGEKPMELAFINGILRSRTFPPLDPWYSGGYINYYYYGQLLIATLIRLTGIAPTTAFNLAIPLLFGLGFTAAFSVAAGITGRAWTGLVGGAALLLVCNLDGLWQAVGQWRALLARQPIAPFDYWASSRVIPFTINEFPFWSFLYGDLHAHLIDLAVVVLVVAACASLLAMPSGRPRGMIVPLGTVALALGATACINTWDFPTGALLVAVTLVLRELGFARAGAAWADTRASWERFWRLRLGRSTPGPLADAASAILGHVSGLAALVGGACAWPAIRRLVVSLAIVVGGAYALYLPFYTHFQSFVSGVGANPTPTNPGQFFTLFGIWLFLLVSFFVLEAHDRLQRMVSARRPDLAQFAARRAWALVAIGAVALTLAALVSLKVVLALLLVVGLVLALDPRHPPAKLLSFMLLLLGLGIALGVEIIYVRDFLDNSDWERMNTVFKFYYQVWVCFALGGALVFGQLAPRALSAGHAVADRGRDDHGRDVRELHQDPAPALAATGGTAGYVAARTGDGAPT
ncbi:MAG TPA: DUF2298 domain-containing protein, partial [Ktedonobacterales bacterium]